MRSGVKLEKNVEVRKETFESGTKLGDALNRETEETRYTFIVFSTHFCTKGSFDKLLKLISEIFQTFETFELSRQKRLTILSVQNISC